MSITILLMAHGAPRNLDEVEEYVLHIRHGRPLPADQMNAIKERYKLVGGSPLLDRTFKQATALCQKFPNSKVYLGMRHSSPFIKDTIAEMNADGVNSFIAICMAPQFSKLSIGAYEEALKQGISETQSSMNYNLVRSFARHPKLIKAFATKIHDVLTKNPSAFVIFTAHSLPERILQEGDSYDYEVKETACLVAKELALPDWRFAYQSQGMTSDKWLGPTVESRIDELQQKGIREIVIAPIGFVCDHVEILYDIDVMFRNYAHDKGITLHRSESLNDSPEFIDLLQELVRERL
jgi:protoporphyrin/coproporphyrin ferrochelatase